LDDAGRVLDTVREPLVFADEPFPEIQTEDLLQLRHGVASEVVVPVDVYPISSRK
jgi:hypothetical protein